MKKIISLLTSATLLVSSASVIAADREARQPDVYVNAAKVEFADQNAYITDEGRTLVPARGVFEAMGCSVEWDEENYIVTVSDSSSDKKIILTIDDTVMKVVSDGKESEVVLEVPAQLMNDRTMIPLRAVSEALGCMIMWNEKSYTINISSTKSLTSEEFNSIVSSLLSGAGTQKPEEPAEPEMSEEEKMKVSIYSESENVGVGEEYEVCVKLDNAYTSSKLGGVTVAFEYDKSALEYVEESGDMYNSNGESSEGTIGVENPKYTTGAKIVFINTAGLSLNESGYVYKCKFKKLKDGEHTIALSNAYDKSVGYEVKITLNGEDGSVERYSGKTLSVDTTPIVLK